MADRAKKISELAVLTAPIAGDLLVIVDDPTGTPITKQITVGNLLGNAAANVVVSNTHYLSANNVVVRRKYTPGSSSGTTDVQGSIWFDDNYIYVAIGPGVIKRAALSTF